MLRFTGRFVLVALVLMTMTFGLAEAKSKKKFVPKTTTEKKAVILNYVQKRFVITKAVKKENLAPIAQIENASIEIDGKGKFPPKSLLVAVAGLDKQINLILPVKFSKGHLRRLGVLGEYDVTFRVTKENLNKKVVNRILSMGLHKKTIEIKPVDLTPEVVEMLKKIHQFELRLMIPEGSVLDKSAIKILRKIPNMKEFIIPADYPPKEISKLKKIKRFRVVVQAKGVGPDKKLVKAVNKLRKIERGAKLRGLIKRDEVFNYLMLDNLSILSMSLEDWEISQEFVNLMNSKGEM